MGKFAIKNLSHSKNAFILASTKANFYATWLVSGVDN